MRRFLEIYQAAWADPVGGGLAELWEEDAEMMHPEFVEPMRGRAAVMDYLRAFMRIAPDLKVRPLAAAAGGQTLFIHFRGEATIAGKPVVWEGVDRFDFPSGGDRAARGIGFFDTTRIRAAIAGAADSEGG